MKRKSLCQSCQERYVEWTPIEDLIWVGDCACGASGFSTERCSCDGCQC